MTDLLRFDAQPTQQFLGLLDPRGGGFTFQTFLDRKGEKDAALTEVIPGPAKDRLLDLHARGAGIYVTVNETDGKGRKSENITRVRAIWREADDPNLPPLPLEPSLVVETSPGHRHEYLLVDGTWPADEQGRADFAAVMERMVQTYGSDKNAKDLCRVLRVPGFLHRKHGTPHRIQIKSVIARRYSRTEILAAFPPIPKKITEAPKRDWIPRDTDEQRIAAALSSINADDRAVWLECGMALKQELGDGGRRLWDDWSSKSSKYDERDQERTWRSFRKNGVGLGTVFHRAQQNGWREERRVINGSTAAVVPFPSRQPEAGDLISAKASSYKMTGIQWLWPDRFAIGKLGIVAGLPDEGKGQTLAYIAAVVTKGGKWPMDEGCSPQGSVIIFSDEDDPNDTLVPRLAAAGADLDRVHIIKMVRDDNRGRMFSLISDLDALRRKIKEIGDVKLVLIDPISAYLGVGKVDSFRTPDVRAVLTPLTMLAVETKVAMISVMHFNKRMDVTNALLRISDSLAFGAVARHVYGVIDDAENDRKLFVRAKNNVAAKSKNKTLAYHFGAMDVAKDEETGQPIQAPYIIWAPEYVDVTAVEAMQAAVESKSPVARDEAKKFLLDILAKGPVLKTEIEEASDANGIAPRTLYRAKTDLKIIAKKDRARHDGKWTWDLPPTEKPPGHWTD